MYDPSIEDPLDLPVAIEVNQLDEQTPLPAQYHKVRAIQAGGGRVLTREPTVVEMAGVFGDSRRIKDFMVQLVFDMGSSTIKSAISYPGIADQALDIARQIEP